MKLSPTGNYNMVREYPACSHILYYGTIDYNLYDSKMVWVGKQRHSKFKSAAKQIYGHDYHYKKQ